MRKKKKKAVILLTSYTAAALLALGLWAWAGHNALADYRLAAKYSSGQAFEETVRAVEALSLALDKSVYAVDGSMCSRVCSEAYANALAAEAAMSTLPFATQELEQLSGFLNVAGDYAYTLAFEAAEEGFSQQQLETLTEMSATASGLANTLRQLRAALGEGGVIMDSREVRLSNAGDENQDRELLSARLLAYEQSFQPMAELEYDGIYGVGKKEMKWRYNDAEMKELAASFAGVSPEELELRYEYEGEDGRVCYAAGDLLVNVSPAGVESMSQSRLVGEALLSASQALEAAQGFLSEHGYEQLQLKDSRVNGALALMRFARMEEDAVCLDNCLSVTVALDDGSVYAFNAAEYTDEPSEAQWNVEQAQAEEALPQGLELLESRKVVIRSEGERDLACYELKASDGKRRVLIYVDASDGRQRRIELEGENL